jgi:hypothetical protein
VKPETDLEHRLAHVLRSGEESCLVVVEHEPFEAAFASFFPTPRVERVLPGHLVAVVADLVVWRWFDAVVVGAHGDRVRLWEAGHGEVLAKARHRGVEYAPGQRAYLSAGLPGADWWVEGRVRDDPRQAVVDVGAAHAFLTEHDLLPASSDER